MKIISWMKRFTLMALCTVLILTLAASVNPSISGAASISDYKSFTKVANKGPVIFGLSHKNEWVPQGMTVVPSKNWLIVAHYAGKGDQASILSITNTKTNKLVKTLYLYETSSKKHTGHVGGLAASKNYLWIASGKKVYRLAIKDIDSKKDQQKIVMTGYGLTHKASYAAYSNGILWIGEYMDNEDAGNKAKKCSPISKKDIEKAKGKLTPRLYGYKLDSKEGLAATSSYKWITPERVQGVAFVKDKVLFSQSCGRTNDSKLLIHNQGTGGKQVSYLTMPPMSEGLAISGTTLYVNFESGAKKYQSGKKLSINHVYKINTTKLKMS